MTTTHTHVITKLANPYLRCNVCAGPASEIVAVEGQVPGCNHQGENVLCGHPSSTSICPSWGPVDGCRCQEHLGHVPHAMTHGAETEGSDG